MKYYVIINGESSLDIQGLVISKLPDISKPLMRNEKIEIDGRDGDIITKLGYSAYDKTIEIGLWGTYDINSIIEYFNQDGVITFSNEPDKYYNFSILNREDYINKLEKFKTASITLHCQPFKYELNEEKKEIENEYVEQTGTSISLSNTLSAPMEIDLKGNTQQDTLSGKNLLPNLVNTQSLNGMNITRNEDGSLTFNNTATSGTNLNINYANDSYIHLESGKTYTASLTNNNGIYFRLAKVGGGGNVMTFDTPNKQATFTSDYTGDCFVYLTILNGTSFNNLTIYPQIELNNQATSYEQYCGGIPSPNPDYPQDVNVVEGINTINVSGKNLLKINDIPETTKNGITYSCSNGEITLNGTSTRMFYIDIQKDFTYSSFNLSGIESSTKSQTIKGYTLSASITNGTISLGHNTVNGLWSIAIGNGRTFDDAKAYIQLEKGSTATNYEPYQNQLYGINLINSLFDISTIVKGDITNNYDTIRLCSRQELWLEAGTYTINTNMPSPFRFSITINSVGKPPLSDYPTYSFDSAWQTTSPYTFTITTAGYCVIQLSKNNNATLTVDEISQYYIQLQKGTETTPYSSIELCKIGTYQDYFYKDSGKWYLHKEVGKVVLDGSESGWERTGTNVFASAIGYVQNVKFYAYFGLCDYYIYNPIQTNVTGNINNGEFAIQYNTDDKARLFFKNTSLSLASNFTTWLSTHNTSVYYPYATPTNTEITDTTLIEQLEAIASATSYEGGTNINQVNNDLPFIITASIFTGTDTITIENKGNTTAKPTMTIYGEGTIGVYLNGNQVFTINLGDEEYITIDTQNMEASKDTILKNRLVVGDYNSFVLQTGDNTLKFTGFVNKVEINNYSRWV